MKKVPKLELKTLGCLKNKNRHNIVPLRLGQSPNWGLIPNLITATTSSRKVVKSFLVSTINKIICHMSFLHLPQKKVK